MCEAVAEAMRTKWTDDDVAKRLKAARERLALCEANKLEDVPVAVLGMVVADVPFLLALVERLQQPHGDVQGARSQ